MRIFNVLMKRPQKGIGWKKNQFFKNTMRLHLIRHADRTLTAPSGNDFDCTLTHVGFEQCKILAKHVKPYLEGIEVWCSGAKRTRQTLSVLEKVVSFGPVTYADTFHLCPKEVFLEHIWASDSDQDLLIIGHNFGISDLVNYLTDSNITMHTAEYIIIDFPGLNRNEISQGGGIIFHQYHP